MAETKNSRRVVLTDICLESDKKRERARAATRQSSPAPIRGSELILPQEQGVHAGLWLDKYIADLQRENDHSRADLVAGVASLGIPLIYEKHFERWKTYLDEIHAETREFRVKKRMAVGLGDKGVLETSVALHHTYGVPYIPGSALKGLAASYARLIAGEEWQQGREPYKVVFGDTDNAGFLTFFDALYIPGSGGGRPLHPDIITVHHPDYYKENQQGKLAPPADWDSPTPIPFLSATGCYLLALAAPELNKSSLWISRVFELLEQALLVLGIGAKTSSGYGRMGTKEMHVTSEEDEAVLQAIDEHLEKIKAMSANQVTSQLRNIYYKWLQVKSSVARRVLADAIIAKAREAHKEPELMRQPWYQNVLRF